MEKKLFLGIMFAMLVCAGCQGDPAPVAAHNQTLLSLPIHALDDGSCGPDNHMCCDSSGQFQCLNNNPVGPNLCPPGFNQPCDGGGPPLDQCGPGNHACCDASGQMQCLTDAPPGIQNLCPPGFNRPCGSGPPPGQCGPGNHACCDATGQVECLTNAPPGMQNLCPPGMVFC